MIISLVTSALVQTSIALQVSLSVLKVEEWSKQCHKPAPIGQDDKQKKKTIFAIEMLPILSYSISYLKQEI